MATQSHYQKQQLADNKQLIKNSNNMLLLLRTHFKTNKGQSISNLQSKDMRMKQQSMKLQASSNKLSNKLAKTQEKTTTKFAGTLKNIARTTGGFLGGAGAIAIASLLRSKPRVEEGNKIIESQLNIGQQAKSLALTTGLGASQSLDLAKRSSVIGTDLVGILENIAQSVNLTRVNEGRDPLKGKGLIDEILNNINLAEGFFKQGQSERGTQILETLGLKDAFVKLGSDFEILKKQFQSNGNIKDDLEAKKQIDLFIKTALEDYQDNLKNVTERIKTSTENQNEILEAYLKLKAEENKRITENFIGYKNNADSINSANIALDKFEDGLIDTTKTLKDIVKELTGLAKDVKNGISNINKGGIINTPQGFNGKKYIIKNKNPFQKLG